MLKLLSVTVNISQLASYLKVETGTCYREKASYTSSHKS